MAVVFLNSNQTHSEAVLIFGLVHLLQIDNRIVRAVQEMQHYELQKQKRRCGVLFVVEAPILRLPSSSLYRLSMAVKHNGMRQLMGDKLFC